MPGRGWIPEPGEGHPYTDRPRDINDTIFLNIGGRRFEVLRATLQRYPGSRLSNIEKLQQHYRSEKDEYYFDRSAIMFEIILNFYRVGELHPPTNVCSVLLRKELHYWGISDYLIEECCWLSYNAQMNKVKTLEKFKKSMVSGLENASDRGRCCDCWYKLQPKVWAFVDDYHSSIAAKIFAWISITFVMISMFTFVAETHVSFRQNMTVVDPNPSGAPQEDTVDTVSQGASRAAESPTVATPGLNNELVTVEYRRRRRDLGRYDLDVDVDTPPDGRVKNEDYTVTPGGATGARRPKRVKRDAAATTPPSFKNEIDNLLLAPIPAFEIIDIVCYAFFTVEYLLRFIFCPSKKMFFKSGLNIVDTCALLPYYVELIMNAIYKGKRYQESFLNMLYVLRIVRIFRVFRMARHYRGLQILVYTLTASMSEIMLMVVFLGIGMLIFASLIYYTDMGGGNFDSIPHGFWWAVVTMTTVGYGDMVPSTDVGYFVGSLCALSGVLMISFTVPVIVNNFMLFYQYVQYHKKQNVMELERASWYERAALCSMSAVFVQELQGVISEHDPSNAAPPSGTAQKQASGGGPEPIAISPV